MTAIHLASEVDVGNRGIDARGSGEEAELYRGSGQENGWRLYREVESVAPVIGEGVGG